MKYKAIIFDMDGTIINTENIWKSAAKKLIENKRDPLEKKAYDIINNKMHGLHLHEACSIIKEEANLDESVERLVEEKCKIADNLYEEGIRFIKGFIEFHNKLVKKGLLSAIATNASRSTLEIAAKKLDFSRFFNNHMYCIDDVNLKGKPEPDIYLYAAKQLGVEPLECIAIEDSAAGIQAAQSAGMFCIGINTAQNVKNIEKANLIVEGYKDIDLEKILC